MDLPGRRREGGNRREIRTGHGRHTDREAERHDRRQRRSWTLEVEIREYVIYSTDWAQDGSNYNGFKRHLSGVLADGKTVYIITFNKVSALYAFDVVTGNEKWRYLPTSKSGSYNMLTVNPLTGDIYYGTTKRWTVLCHHAGRRVEVDLLRSRFNEERRPGRQC